MSPDSSPIMRAIGVRLLTASIVLSPIVAAAPQTRVASEAAMSHVLERVEPVIPPGVDTAGVEIIADVIVGIDGRVEDVRILASPPALQKAASDALAKWKFAPFSESGRPTQVRTIIEFKYPNPKLERERAAVSAAFAALMTCNRRIESAAPEAAVAACTEAVRIAETLPADRTADRELARAAFATSLIRAGRTGDGLDLMKRVLDERVARTGADDADVAEGYRAIGITYQRTGDLVNADKYLTQAVTSFERALASLPDFRDMYAPRMSRAIRDLAAVKRARGDEAVASSLEDRARAVTASATVIAPPVVPMRSIANITCIGPLVSILTGNDVAAIRTVATSPGGPAPWLLITRTSGFGSARGGGSQTFWPIDVYLKPDVVTPSLRRGQLVSVAAATASANDYALRQAWTKMPRLDVSYAQVLLPGRDPNEVTSDRDLNRPIQIFGGPMSTALSDAEVLSLVRFLRDEAKSSGRAFTDIQPWAITEVFVMQTGVMVSLIDSDPAKLGGQSVELQRKNGTWVISTIIATGR